MKSIAAYVPAWPGNHFFMWTGSENFNNGTLPREDIFVRIDGARRYRQWVNKYALAWNPHTGLHRPGPGTGASLRRSSLQALRSRHIPSRSADLAVHTENHADGPTLGARLR
jgi:hypothetical protein